MIADVRTALSRSSPGLATDDGGTLTLAAAAADDDDDDNDDELSSVSM